MPISPIQPSWGASQSPRSDPIVDKFNDLWNAWYDNPTQKSAEALIDYMKKNYSHFEKLAEKKPLPHPDVSFEDAFFTSIKYLQGWIDDGCNPHAISPPSEFVADVAKWVNYAR